MIDNHFNDFQETVRRRLHDRLKAQLPSHTIPEINRLYDALRYTTINTSKFVRPMLVYAVGSCFGAPLQNMDIPAMAVELIHTYSLIHDDLPAMDDSDLRRGKPSCHKAFNEATAILAGDALQAVAFNILSNQPLLSDRQCLDMVHVLGRAALKMVTGQMLDVHADINAMTIERLQLMHRGKTGALIKASVLLGAIATNCDQETISRLEKFSDCVGLAFQIQDDILDEEGSTEALGKPAAHDEHLERTTYTKLLGLATSKEKLFETNNKANEILNEFDIDTALLKKLSDYVIERSH